MIFDHREQGPWVWSTPDEEPPFSDKEYLISINGFLRIAYYYRDSTGPHWSSTFDQWNNEYTGYVTWWADIPIPPDTREK